MQVGIYDVFATRPFDGNQAAVVEAASVSTHQLVALAREFLLPETVLLRRQANRLSLKFATSAGPIARCGHGMLAAVTHAVLNPTGDEKRLTGEYEVGTQRAVWSASEVTEHSVRVSVTWPDRPEHVGNFNAHKLLSALGLSAANVSTRLPVGIYNSGNRNALLPVATAEMLDALIVNWGTLEDIFTEHTLTDVEVYAVEEILAENCVRLRCRNVFPYGVKEEAATGSAAVSLAASLVDAGVVPDVGANEIKFLIHQGVGERRGNLTVRLTRQAAGRSDLYLEGMVFRIVTGHLVSIPPDLTRGGPDDA